MKEDLTEIVIVLDRSGSMEHLRNDVIRAFNNFLEEQKEFFKEAPGRVLFTTVLFNDSYKLLYDRLDIDRAAPMSSNDYMPQGRGALNDAFGKVIDDLGYTLNATPEEERPGKVALIVITNESDNASALYSTEKLVAMTDLQTRVYSWEFLFLGVNIDPRGAAASFGIPPDRAFDITGDAEGVSVALKAAGVAVHNLRKHRSLYAENAPNFRDTIRGVSN